MKKILIGLLVLAVIIGGASFFLLGKLDDVIAEAIKKYGTEAVGSSVNVSAVKTDLKAGKITITGLTVANPKGYSKPYAFELKDLTTQVDYKNKEIAEIIVQSPNINAELEGSLDIKDLRKSYANSNFKELVDGMPASADGEGSSESSSSDEIELTIRSFKVVSTNVNLVTNVIGNHQFVMEDFAMKDIKGTPSAIASLISDRLIKHVSDQVTQFAKKEVEKMAKDEVKEQLKDALKDKLKGLNLKLN